MAHGAPTSSPCVTAEEALTRPRKVSLPLELTSKRISARQLWRNVFPSPSPSSLLPRRMPPDASAGFRHPRARPTLAHAPPSTTASEPAAAALRMACRATGHIGHEPSRHPPLRCPVPSCPWASFVPVSSGPRGAVDRVRGPANAPRDWVACGGAHQPLQLRSVGAAPARAGAAAAACCATRATRRWRARLSSRVRCCTSRNAVVSERLRLACRVARAAARDCEGGRATHDQGLTQRSVRVVPVGAAHAAHAPLRAAVPTRSRNDDNKDSNHSEGDSRDRTGAETRRAYSRSARRAVQKARPSAPIASRVRRGACRTRRERAALVAGRG